MMHDFALTARACRLHGPADRLPTWTSRSRATATCLSLERHYGARFGVMRRDDPFGPVRWFDIDPCYVFHVASAYDSGNSVCCRLTIPRALAGHWRIRSRRRVLWSWTID